LRKKIKRARAQDVKRKDEAGSRKRKRGTPRKERREAAEWLRGNTREAQYLGRGRSPVEISQSRPISTQKEVIIPILMTSGDN
jgi:hypothetical protein